MVEIVVIEDPATAEVSLDPVPTRILRELVQPGSATQLAERLGLPRQKVNCHLKALEKHGLVDLVEERRKGNVTERILQAPDGFARLRKALGVDSAEQGSPWTWSSTAWAGFQGKWTFPTSTSWACALPIPCTAFSAAMPGVAPWGWPSTISAVPGIQKQRPTPGGNFLARVYA